GRIFASIGNAEVSAVDTRDIAAIAAITLTQGGHDNTTYDLTGPEALTHHAMAAKLSQPLGRPIRLAQVDSGAMRAALLAAGFPEWQADGLIEDYAHYARQEATAVTPTITQITGQAPRSFDDFAYDYRNVFLNAGQDGF